MKLNILGLTSFQLNKTLHEVVGPYCIVAWGYLANTRSHVVLLTGAGFNYPVLLKMTGLGTLDSPPVPYWRAVNDIIKRRKEKRIRAR